MDRRREEKRRRARRESLAEQGQCACPFIMEQLSLGRVTTVSPFDSYEVNS